MGTKPRYLSKEIRRPVRRAYYLKNKEAIKDKSLAFRKNKAISEGRVLGNKGRPPLVETSLSEGVKVKTIRNKPLSGKEYCRKVRLLAIEVLGSRCVRCDFGDTRALQIDHINGGGSKERKERNYKGNFHNHVVRSFLNRENKYQLLCANCNWIKRSENDERNKQQ